jgi:cellulose biosynthesis protein BcsQ
MQLVLLDEDQSFVNMMAAYIRTTGEYAERLSFKGFTNKELGFAYLGSLQSPCMLVIHQSFFPLPSNVFQQKPGSIVFLSESPVLSDVVEYPILFKYQPLNQLLSQLLAHHNRYRTEAPIRGRKRTLVTSVYSAAGGAGKTTVSFYLAKQLALRGERVLLLNLELIAAQSLIFPQTGQDPFGQLLYYAKSSHKQLAAKIEQLKSSHSLYKFDYLEQAVKPEELENTEEEDIRRLIEAAVSLGAYDHIVIDLDCSCHPRVHGALEVSDRLWWVVQDDIQHVYKLASLLQVWRGRLGEQAAALLQRSELIVNKFTGTLTNRFESAGLRIGGTLPYVPQWKSIAKSDLWLNCALYDSAMIRLLQQHGSEAGKEAGVAGS